VNDQPKLMRDAFLEEVYSAMSRSEDIYFLTADFGAVALDKMREEYPERVFHMGICEQNMVDFAAGLAMVGKRVFLYAMAPFLIARAYEQIKSVVSAMSLPMTFVGVGVGLGYDHATLTHFTPEDFVLSRIIRGMNVYTPSDDLSARNLANKVLNTSGELSYIRLERSMTSRLEAMASLDATYRMIVAKGRHCVVLTTGYMSHVLSSLLHKDPVLNVSLIDVIKNFPLGKDLIHELANYDLILVVEEQARQGGMAASIFEAFLDFPRRPRIESLSLDRNINIANGNRSVLHEINGISPDHIKSKILELIK